QLSLRPRRGGLPWLGQGRRVWLHRDTSAPRSERVVDAGLSSSAGLAAATVLDQLPPARAARRSSACTAAGLGRRGPVRAECRRRLADSGLVRTGGGGHGRDSPSPP